MFEIFILLSICAGAVLYRFRGSSAYFPGSVVIGTYGMTFLMILIQGTMTPFSFYDFEWIRDNASASIWLFAGKWFDPFLFGLAWLIGESFAVGNPIGRALYPEITAARRTHWYQVDVIARSLHASIIVRSFLYGGPLILAGFVPAGLAVGLAWGVSLWGCSKLPIKDFPGWFNGLVPTRWAKFEIVCGAVMTLLMWVVLATI